MPIVKREKIGVIGHRSWIAKALIQRITDTTDDIVVCIDKLEVLGTLRTMDLDVIYVIPGRARPTTADMTAEVEMLQAYADNVGTKTRTVFLSSMSVDDGTPYGQHKSMCENLMAFGCPKVAIIRAPAVFGPTQDLQSSMLVPSLARTDGAVKLHRPDDWARFIHLDDLVDYIVSSAGRAVGLHTQFPGSFVIRPRDMSALYETWRLYREFTGARRDTDV